MRSNLTPEEFRAAGIYLNVGRRRGWRKHLAVLLATPEPTIASWASRTPANARSIPGSTAVALKLLVAMLRQKELAEGNLLHAAQVVTDQVLALLRVADFVPPPHEALQRRPERIRERPPPGPHPGP